MLERKKTSHKGENGIVTIIGGSELYVGSTILCSLAVLRSGADLVYLCAPELVSEIANVYSPDIISLKLKGNILHKTHLKQIVPFIKKSDVVLIGNGAGLNRETITLMKNAILKCIGLNKKLVIDADALKILDKKLFYKLKNCVLTPHKKEFQIMTKAEPIKANVKKYSSKERIILLKGPIDYISDGKIVKENKTGNEGMTHGGTGDILAGLVAGLIAQKMDLFKAAVVGAYINGKAGDICLKKKGYSFLASDLVEEYSKLLRRV